MARNDPRIERLIDQAIVDERRAALDEMAQRRVFAKLPVWERRAQFRRANRTKPDAPPNVTP
jgi:hypothetical protein